MRRRHGLPDVHPPLALDEETAERLLTGDLHPALARLGYAEVAELRAVTRTRPGPRQHRRAGRRSRRRRVGLAVVVVTGALARPVVGPRRPAATSPDRCRSARYPASGAVGQAGSTQTRATTALADPAYLRGRGVGPRIARSSTRHDDGCGAASGGNSS
jgi:hypothetical protein